MVTVTHYRGSIEVYPSGRNPAYVAGFTNAKYSVPSTLGPVTYGRISILVWGADERGWRPEYEHWNMERSRPLTGFPLPVVQSVAHMSRPDWCLPILYLTNGAGFIE